MSTEDTGWKTQKEGSLIWAVTFVGLLAFVGIIIGLSYALPPIIDAVFPPMPQSPPLMPGVPQFSSNFLQLVIAFCSIYLAALCMIGFIVGWLLSFDTPPDIMRGLISGSLIGSVGTLLLLMIAFGSVLESMKFIIFALPLGIPSAIARLVGTRSGVRYLKKRRGQ